MPEGASPNASPTGSPSGDGGGREYVTEREMPGLPDGFGGVPDAKPGPHAGPRPGAKPLPSVEGLLAGMAVAPEPETVEVTLGIPATALADGATPCC